MKILHLITDHQVIERTLGVYEALFPNTGDVLVFHAQENTKHLSEHKKSPRIGRGQGLSYGRSFDFTGYTQIIAHYLTMDMIDFIKSVPSGLHVTWEIYGYDLYNEFLEPLGQKLYYSDTTKFVRYGFFRRIFPELFNRALEMRGYLYKTTKHKLAQFDYICNRVDSLQCCCSYDAKFVEDYSKRSIPSYEVFNYSLDEVLGNLKDTPFFESTGVMVGNSASFSNNHMYVLEQLKQKGVKACDFILPLSYGGSPKYVDYVEKSFIAEYHTNVKIIRNYMPLHEYNKIFMGLRSMIMSSWRQESIGTIIMGLYLGIKVFMSERSPLYKSMSDCGFCIFPIEQATSEDLLVPLPIETKKHNRSLVLSHYSYERFAEILRNNLK